MSLIGYYLGLQLNGAGGASPLPLEHIEKNTLKDIHWLHLHANYPETKTWLTEKSNLDPIVINALTAEETRPRMFEVSDGAVIILRGVNLNHESDPELSLASA